MGDPGGEQPRGRSLCDSGRGGQQAVRAHARRALLLRGKAVMSGLKDVRLIDLSVAIEHEAPGELETPRVDYITHAAGGLETMRRVFGCGDSDLSYSGGQGWAVEVLTASSHTGTHVDAPYHYGAISGGKPAR